MVKKNQKKMARNRITRKCVQKVKFSAKYNQSNEENNQLSNQSQMQLKNQNENSISNQQDQSQSQEQKVKDYAIKHMEFRSKRGTKMTYLINRKKEQEEDSFWKSQGLQYFGDLDDGDNEAEDYVESSSGRDEFDSDFDQTESQPENDDEELKSNEEQEKKRNKRKKQGFMREIQSIEPKKKNNTKTSATAINNPSKTNKKQTKIPIEPINRYIHQVMTQEQLLGQAAHTQYFNWKSLQKLISIEMERKDFSAKQHHIQGNKIIYRDIVSPDKAHNITYELDGVTIKQVSDLTNLWK